MPDNPFPQRLKVAIIGGGPAGLGAAIELARLPFVDWTLYEKKPQISETGGGISLQAQTWRLLEHNGAAKNIRSADFFRSEEGLIEQRRNGRSGKLLIQIHNSGDIPLHHQTCRLTRAKLQSALLKNVDQTHIRLNKRLIGIEHLSENRVRILFDDDDTDEVDLVVAADGMRSTVRNFSFPNHTLRHDGRFVYRTIVSKAEAQQLNCIPWAPVFWKHSSGLYVYTCPLGDNDFEVTARIRRSREEGQSPVSWGHPFDFHTVLDDFDDFCHPVREVLQLAARGETQEFALFSGPRLEHIVSHGNIAFIGDAIHPLQGNFGSGAGFALEDVYALAKVLEWAWLRRRPLPEGLELFDSIRSPHYERLFGAIDRFSAIKASLQSECLLIDEEIAERVKRISRASESWMYHYEIDAVVDQALLEADRKHVCGSEAVSSSTG
ncbi:hypothetical protein BDW72DRAFT_199244 [Aspergillus terricola var. indicus]